MRFEYREPILASVQYVLNAVLQAEVTAGEESFMSADEFGAEVAIITQLTGDSEGGIILSMNNATAVGLCSLMTGSPCVAVTEEGLDAMRELTNMITGNAASALNDLGFDLSVSPPGVVPADKIRELMRSIELVRFPVASSVGEISLHVALRLR